MKKVLLSLMAIGGMTLGLAQTTVWMDDFNDEDISDWTLIDADLDGNNWGDQFAVTNTDGNAVTPVSLISRSWQGSPLTPDNWAITPAIDLSGTTGTISLEYVTQVANQAWDEEHYSVYVATNNAISDFEASSTQFSETLGDAGDTGTPVQKSFDISDFAGESEVYIAFRHHDVTDMDYISIDDVTVLAETLSTRDLSAVKSVSSVYPNPATDVVNVRLSEGFDSANVTVVLTNVSGKQVASYKSVEDINVSDLPSGVYVMTITDGKKTETKKFIKK